MELISIESMERMKTALSELESLRGVAVTNQHEYEAAAGVLVHIKGAVKTIEADRAATVKPLSERVKTINDRYKTVIAQLRNGYQKIGDAMTGWYQQEERNRRIEQRESDDAAEKLQLQQEAAIQKETAKAAAYRDQGRIDLAERADNRADAKREEAATAVSLEIAPIKVSGISYRDDYVVIIKDKKKAVIDLMSSQITEHLVVLSEGGLRSLARSSRGEIEIDGIVLIKTKSQVVRS